MADLSKLPPPPAGYTIVPPGQLPPPPAGYSLVSPADAGAETSPGNSTSIYGSPQDAPRPPAPHSAVPGMEKLGGAPPGVPTVEMGPDLNPDYSAPSSFINPRTGKRGTDRTIGHNDPATNYLDSIWTGATEGVEQIANPKPGMTPNTANPPSVASQVAGGASKVLRAGMKTAAPALIPAALESLVPVAVGAAAGLTAGAAGGTAVRAGLGAMGASEGVQDLGEDLGNIAVGGWAATRAPGAARALGAKFARDPKTSMVKALKPAATNTKFKENLDRSLPELKTTEAELGRPVESLADLLEATKLAKKRVYDQYLGIRNQPSIDPYTKQPMAGASPGEAHVDMTPVADAMQASVSQKLWRENPKAAQKIVALADKYRTTMPFSEAESILKTTNNELEAFYAKYPPAQRAALERSAGSWNSTPKLAMKKAQGDAIRDVLYNHLDSAGEGAAPREFKQRYGSLMNMEREVYRRQNVAERQQPDSLIEQAGKLSAVGDAAKGFVKSLATGQPGSALLGVAEGAAKWRTAKWLKEQQTTDALIKAAFKRYQGSPAPVDTPPPFQPKALLNGPDQPGGTYYTPPPADTSGGGMQPLAPHQEVNRMRKALPVGTAPFGQGTVVPDILGRPDLPRYGGQYLLEAPARGGSNFTVLPTGPPSVRLPSNQPMSRGNARQMPPLGMTVKFDPATKEFRLVPSRPPAQRVLVPPPPVRPGSPAAARPPVVPPPVRIPEHLL